MKRFNLFKFMTFTLLLLGFSITFAEEMDEVHDLDRASIESQTSAKTPLNRDQFNNRIIRDIRSDEVWTKEGSPYLSEHWINIHDGATLTIEPGVVVMFGPAPFAKQAGIVVMEGGSLKIEGLSDQRVHMTSSRQVDERSPGDWFGIEVLAGAKADIDHALIEYGGQWSGNQNILIQSSDVTIRNTDIRHSHSKGINIQRPFSGSPLSPVLRDINLESYGDYAIYQSNPSDDPLYENISVDNMRRSIYITGGNIDRHVSWEYPGVPYIVGGWLNIVDGGALNIATQSSVRFNPLGVAKQGSITLRENGSLSADGVLFTSNKIPTPENQIGPGDWADIDVFPGADLTLKNCILEYGGQWGAGTINVKSSEVLIENTSIKNSLGSGIVFDGEGISPRLTNLTIQDSELYGIRVVKNMKPLYDNITQVGNNPNGIDYRPTNINLDVDFGEDEGPYYLGGWYSILDGASLNIKPGAKIKFRSIGPAKQSSLIVRSGGRLNAIGTPSNPITLTSVGRDGVKSPGNWDSLEFESASSGTVTYVDFEYGGQWGYGNLITSSSSVVFENNRFSESSSEAIRVQANAKPISISNNKFNIDNNYFGVNNTTPTTVINASNNWWNHATGPYHPDMNPSGKGVKVSSGVSFSPFIKSIDSFDGVEWPSKSLISLNHEWTVEFNLDIDPATASSNTIWVEDLDGNRVSPDPTVSNNKVKVKPPLGGYSQDETYYLYVAPDVKSKDGRPLGDSARMKFSTAIQL